MRIVIFLSIAGTIREPCPIDVDTQTALGNPFRFKEWISQHRQQIDSSGKMAVFDPTKHQLQASHLLGLVHQ